MDNENDSTITWGFDDAAIEHRRIRVEEIMEALAELPEQERVIWNLKTRTEGPPVSNQEIATMLAIEPETVEETLRSIIRKVFCKP